MKSERLWSVIKCSICVCCAFVLMQLNYKSNTCNLNVLQHCIWKSVRTYIRTWVCLYIRYVIWIKSEYTHFIWLDWICFVLLTRHAIATFEWKRNLYKFYFEKKEIWIQIFELSSNWFFTLNKWTECLCTCLYEINYSWKLCLKK